MKQCPFCKAELEDNARFCLFCMRSLTKKVVIPPIKKHSGKYWILSAAAALLLIAAIGIFVSQEGHQPDASQLQENPPANLLESISQDTIPAVTDSGESVTESTSQNSQPQEEAPTQGAPIPSPGYNDDVVKPEPTSPPATVPPETVPPSTTPTVTEPTPTVPPVTEPTPTAPPVTKPQETAPEVTDPPETEFVQTALPGDPDFVVQMFIEYPNAPEVDHVFEMNLREEKAKTWHMWEGYVNPGNEYYICSNYSNMFIKNGIYVIPEYMPQVGRIVGLGHHALSNHHVVSVILAESIQFIDDEALTGNSQLAHIYFSSKIMNIDESAFPPVSERQYQLVIHCPADATDFRGRYWKDIAADYGAVWQEWNG